MFALKIISNKIVITICKPNSGVRATDIPNATPNAMEWLLPFRLNNFSKFSEYQFSILFFNEKDFLEFWPDTDFFLY